MSNLMPGRRSALFLLRLGLSLLLVGVGWLIIEWLVIGQAKVPPPTSMAGLTLSEQVMGQAALAEIERLHGKIFPMTDGAVAHYGNGLATVWISSTWLPFMAARQVEAMTDRIAEAGGRSPFTPIGTIEIEDTPVYVLTGMGQMHYYFQLDRRVVWLAVFPQFAEQSLEDLIRQLHN